MSKIDEITNEIRSTPGLKNRMVKYGVVGGLLAIPLPFTMPVGVIVGAAVAYARRKRT